MPSHHAFQLDSAFDPVPLLALLGGDWTLAEEPAARRRYECADSFDWRLHAAGLALVMMETLNDIGASEYLGVNTLTLSIFTTWLNRGSLAGAAQIACVMLVVVAGLIALERAARRGREYTGLDRDPRRRARHGLRGAPALLAATACFAPLWVPARSSV